MKRKIYVMMISLLLLSVTFCSNNIIEPIQYDPDAMRVAGNYIATTFIIPTPNDGSFDVLANGGMITVVLSLEFAAKGRIVIKNYPTMREDWSYETFDETFEGSYKVKNDSLQFKNMDNILSHSQLFFIIKEKKLEGQLISISSTIIILEKVN